MKDLRALSVTALLQPTVDPQEFSSTQLYEWLSRPRIPVLKSNDPLTRVFIESMVTENSAQFIYVGGSKPGSARSIRVSLVFQHEVGGRIYIAGYCEERRSNRIFALDLSMIIHAWS